MNTTWKLKALLVGVAGPLIPATALAVDIDVQGFVRQETAVSFTGTENPYNQHGNLFNGYTVARDSTLIAGAADTVVRDVSNGDNELNLFTVRTELDVTANFTSNLTGYAQIRAVYDPGFYDDFEDPNFFNVPFHGDRANRLEVADSNYMIDLQALYLDFNEGPLWIRLGNQQIAWGESLFFRVLDVPNGLDLRRHLILDWAAEEYADERVPSPGIRGSYRFGQDTELELFGQLFNPSILPNPNTPYNLIPTQFTVHQEEGFDDAEDDINFGGRLQTKIGELALQAIAVHRTNPDGVFRWTDSGAGPLAGTPFEISTTGVRSAQEWFTYASMVRLDGVGGLNAAVRDFQPVTGGLGAFEAGNFALASAELDFFFQAFGGLRGHIERVYPEENIFGLGANYLIFDEPGSWLDQLVVRAEATVTPDKKFTSPSLSRQFVERDEVAASFVLEKYQRFSEDFPATFLVFQYLYKSDSDLFGRLLDGNGASPTSTPDGDDGFHAFVLAAQQPFPNLIWRADLSVLADVNGGALIQPGVRWKPNDQFAVELYGNFTLTDGGNDDIIDTIDFVDEIAARITFQF
ncbi:MAG: DUF1302 family protein [Alphaproteobacteria bacterium]|nr:DUF1302 family protein [Alphaproteobacteria bacterium]